MAANFAFAKLRPEVKVVEKIVEVERIVEVEKPLEVYGEKKNPPPPPPPTGRIRGATGLQP